MTKKTTTKTKAKVRHTPYWWRALADAKRRGGTSEVLVGRAEGWETCACGKQSTLIPRLGNGCPVDLQLDTLGTRFYKQVRAACNDARYLDRWSYGPVKPRAERIRSIKRAIATMEKIERRSALLVKNLTHDQDHDANS